MLRSVARGRDPSAGCNDVVGKACCGGGRNGARLDRQVLHETERRSVHGGAVRLSLVAVAGRRDGMPVRRGHQRSRPGRSQRTRRTGPKRSCPRPSATQGHWPGGSEQWQFVRPAGNPSDWLPQRLVSDRDGGAGRPLLRRRSAAAKALRRSRLGRGEHADGGTAARQVETSAKRAIRRTSSICELPTKKESLPSSLSQSRFVA